MNSDLGTLRGDLRLRCRNWFEENWDPKIHLGEWWARLASSGWGLPTWPALWFGLGLSPNEAAVITEERRRCGALGPPSGVGVMMAGPTLLVCGSEAQKKSFIPPLVRGEEVWCQLFSEPNAGSDLASLRTHAERDGDEWVVNGQKVWTSGAQYSRWGLLLARTDPGAPKHRGITFFVIDMKQPGIEVRPLREMTGEAMFSEVFFADARVPDANRIGACGEGWRVAMTTLSHERASMGGDTVGSADGGDIIGMPDLSQPAGSILAARDHQKATGPELLLELARQSAKAGDPVIRQSIMRVYCLAEAARFTRLRTEAAVKAGGVPGLEVSIGKLVASALARGVRDTAMGILGPHGMLAGDDAPMGGMIQRLTVTSPCISIAGGTDEVQRNVIGERVLGLAPEPRPDKQVPFEEMLLPPTA